MEEAGQKRVFGGIYLKKEEAWKEGDGKLLLKDAKKWAKAEGNKVQWVDFVEESEIVKVLLRDFLSAEEVVQKGIHDRGVVQGGVMEELASGKDKVQRDDFEGLTNEDFDKLVRGFLREEEERFFDETNFFGSGGLLSGRRWAGDRRKNYYGMEKVIEGEYEEGMQRLPDEGVKEAREALEKMGVSSSGATEVHIAKNIKTFKESKKEGEDETERVKKAMEEWWDQAGYISNGRGLYISQAEVVAISSLGGLTFKRKRPEGFKKQGGDEEGMQRLPDEGVKEAREALEKMGVSSVSGTAEVHIAKNIKTFKESKKEGGDETERVKKAMEVLGRGMIIGSDDSVPKNYGGNIKGDFDGRKESKEKGEGIQRLIDEVDPIKEMEELMKSDAEIAIKECDYMIFKFLKRVSDNLMAGEGEEDVASDKKEKSKKEGEE